MAFTCLFLPLLLVVLSSGSITPPNPPQFVYRADFRGPQSIFPTGMKSHGTCENVYFHVEGRNCREGSTAFISTSAQEFKANKFGVNLLMAYPQQQSISIYEIRADQRFYSAYYSLMNAAVNYNKKGKEKKARKYAELADTYQYEEEEWMAYKEIPTALVKKATTYYRRHLENEGEKGTVDFNKGYVDADTVASKQAFPESKKGCPPRLWQLLKTCIKKIG